MRSPFETEAILLSGSAGDAIDAWTPPRNGKRGGQPIYSDIAIETSLTLRLVFHLPLRQAEGFLKSILKLMELYLPCPDHTTVVPPESNGKRLQKH